jgi:hypothetical protein
VDRKTLHVLMLEDNPADTEIVQFELEESSISFDAKVVVTKGRRWRKQMNKKRAEEELRRAHADLEAMVRKELQCWNWK